MATLLYSPEVRVHVEIADGSILDVSADLASCDLTLTENAVNTFNFVLNNNRRKYDRVFTPNDRVVVQMKRIKWLQVFSGYLDSVPFFSVYPRKVPLAASDTLKRLKYRYWDSGADASIQLLMADGSDPNDSRAQDGGLSHRTVRLLTEVAQWPAENIHIGALPSDWFEIVAKIQSKFINEAAAQQAAIAVGGAATIAGGTGGAAAGVAQMAGPVQGQTGVLPATSGLCSTFAGPGDPTTKGGFMALTGESGFSPGVPEDPKGLWYCAMRWPYINPTTRKYTTNSADAAKAIAWWKGRRLLVTNPKTNKVICVRAADWGPGGVASADRRVLDLAPAAAQALGVNTDSQVDIRFAQDQSTPLGPVAYTVTTQAGVAHGALAAGGAAAKQDAGFAAAASPTVTPPGAPHPFSVMDAVVPAGTVSFTPVQGIGSGNTSAAHQFIAKMWTGLHGVGGFRAGSTVAGTGSLDDHSRGYAVDCMVNTGGKYPSDAEEQLGNSIALWFIQNPSVFGTKYVIWKNHINGRGHETEGWRQYSVGDRAGGGPTLDHWDHVHISFTGGGDGPDVTALGPNGGGWAGGDLKDAFWSKGFGTMGALDGNTATSSSAGGSAAAISTLLNTYLWDPQINPLSEQLGGYRALMNDQPILETIASMCQASMRSYMAAPNGDFIAWFPDYFGLYGIAGRLHVADIEIVGDGFTMMWSDDNLITHQFTAGAPSGGYNQGNPTIGGVVDEVEMFTTAGIATVEFPEIMEALFNVARTDPAFKQFFDSDTILKRYGARPNYQPLGTITGPTAEFWYALYLFQKNWASQFSCEVPLTFMPEAWPGMLMVLDSYKFQAYIESVSHRIDFGDGGGFSTSVRLVAPSRLDGGGLFGLPAGGGQAAVKASGKPTPKASPPPAKPPAKAPGKK